MKNAILISGRPGSGKTPLAAKIKRTFKRTGHMNSANPQTSWLAPGTDVVVVEEVASPDELEKFIGFITGQPIKIHKGERPPFEVSPFFIFTSQKVRLLPHYLSRHIRHVDCYEGGMCMVNIHDLPEKVIAAIHGHAEKVNDYRRSSASPA